MATLYLDLSGAVLCHRQGRFVVQYQGKAKEYLEQQVEEVVLCGHVQLTSHTMRRLLELSIPTALLTSSGRLLGRLVPPQSANVRLRMRQYDCVRDSARALPFARWFVIGKIRNGKEFLCRRLEKLKINASQLREQLRKQMEIAGRVFSLERLRGFEGIAARQYYDAYGLLFTGTPFRWRGRRHHPPTDPINALLSLGYTLLTNRCITALERVGLDPYAGFLHGGREHSRYGLPALAVDLAEEFRYLVDRVVVTTVRNGTFRPEHFSRQPDGSVLLAPEARRRWFEAWEKTLRSKVRYDHRRLSYREIIDEQARRLARAIERDDLDYRPFMP